MERSRNVPENVAKLDYVKIIYHWEFDSTQKVFKFEIALAGESASFDILRFCVRTLVTVIYTIYMA